MSRANLRKPILVVAVATVLLLLVPVIAMQLTLQVSWGLGDFIVAGALMFGTGVLAVLGIEHCKGTRPRIALIIGLAVGFLVVWAELAVGLFT